MTYEEKISWLSRYREAEKLYQRLSYRLAEAQEAARHITQNPESQRCAGRQQRWAESRPRSGASGRG